MRSELDAAADPEAEPNEVVLQVPAKTDYVALVRVVLSAAASIDPDSRDDRVDDLRVAVSEAVTNAVEAHQLGGTDRHIEVRCRTSSMSNPGPRNAGTALFRGRPWSATDASSGRQDRHSVGR